MLVDEVMVDESDRTVTLEPSVEPQTMMTDKPRFKLNERLLKQGGAKYAIAFQGKRKSGRKVQPNPLEQ